MTPQAQEIVKQIALAIDTLTIEISKIDRRLTAIENFLKEQNQL